MAEDILLGDIDVHEEQLRKAVPRKEPLLPKKQAGHGAGERL